VTRGTGGVLDPQLLIDEFKVYDRAVDVVSIYHWLFTATKELPKTVRHFERYPKVQVTRNDETVVLTPDFTVLFSDGTGIVAEIANLALHDNSVEKLCNQLNNYGKITHLQDRDGSLVLTAPVDVRLLTPVEMHASAARRIFNERIDESDHRYKPLRRPVLAHFSALPDKYVIHFWANEVLNGALHQNDREPNYATFTDGLNIPAEYFAQNKVTHAFMNDPVKPLYLATRLWANVFPSAFGVSGTELELTSDAIVTALRSQYGVGRSNDVAAAMRILVAADVATEVNPRKWKVKRRSLRSDGDDVHGAIAERVAKRAVRKPSRRKAASTPPQELALFDFSTEAE
jgi:hypothetical protein